jgi:chorismate mutase
LFIRGIRGATTVIENNKEEILKETSELLEEIFAQNKLILADIASIFFSVTSDIDQAFPALAARNLGLTDTALLCFNEISVPNSIKKCIRVLIHVNTEKTQSQMKHIYLKEAKKLRPDKEAINKAS